MTSPQRLSLVFGPVKFFAIAALLIVSGHGAADHDRSIVAHVTGRFDLNAMSDFLARVLHRHPSVDEVDLERTTIGSMWRVERVSPPSRMRSGDWVLWVRGDDDVFELYYIYAPGKCVTITAKRLAKDRFEFLRIAKSEMVSLQ